MNVPYIIAEVGSNFRNLSDCLDSVVAAKTAGADAVKFQLFTSESLYGFHVDNVQGMLPVEWVPKIAEYAGQKGIDFLCSAFSTELIDIVDPYVKMHKVASAELSHLRMLEKLKRIGKPVILSTGGSGHMDIAQALQVLGDTPTTLMYCVSAYPAREVDLERIPILGRHFSRDVGFSDHTLDIYNISKFAVQYYGAVVVEKHFTLTHELSTPDVGHSLSPDEFRNYVDSIRRRTISAPGDCPVSGRVHSYAGEERDMILRHNRRLIATRDIQVGETFKENINYGIYRSMKDDAHAYSPFMLIHRNSPEGHTANRMILKGTGIGPGDF